MCLILFDVDGPQRRHFWPLALSRPIWELRCGMTTLGEQWVAKTGATDVAYVMPEYLAPVWKQRTEARVNDPASLRGDDLLLINVADETRIPRRDSPRRLQQARASGPRRGHVRLAAAARPHA